MFLDIKLRIDLEHMSTYICVEHKLSSIGSLAIVSLGVSYKYILTFSVEQELWNCTMFVTRYYKH